MKYFYIFFDLQILYFIFIFSGLHSCCKSSVVWDYFILTLVTMLSVDCALLPYYRYELQSVFNIKHDLSKRKRLAEEVDNPSTTEPASNSNLMSRYTYL